MTLEEQIAQLVRDLKNAEARVLQLEKLVEQHALNASRWDILAHDFQDRLVQVEAAFLAATGSYFRYTTEKAFRVVRDIPCDQRRPGIRWEDTDGDQLEFSPDGSMCTWCLLGGEEIVDRETIGWFSADQSWLSVRPVGKTWAQVALEASGASPTG